MTWKLKPLKFTREMLIRIVADTLLINVALQAAFILRFIFLITFESPYHLVPDSEVFWDFLSIYAANAGPLTLICLITFYFCGFYTFGRAYRGRFKLVIITQAVTLSFLLYGFFLFLLGGVAQFPRGVLILSWLLCLGVLISARLWSLIWRNVLRVEKPLTPVEAGENQRILVIGGAGYIGSALLAMMLERGYRVRLLDLLIYGTEPIKNLLQHPNLEIMPADFRQVEKVVEAARDMDHVIHLGAIVGDPACSLDEELTIEVNLTATRMIGEVAKGSRCRRFIFASTCSVYGAGDEVLDEQSALNPVSLYARSKIASEKVLKELADENFMPIILRFGTIYGLSGRNRFDLVVNLFAAKAVIDGQISVFGGDQWRPFLHVEDAALSILTVLEAPASSVRHQVFNVGSNEQNYTISQVAEIVKQLVPHTKLLHSGSDADKRNYRGNFHKIRQRINFLPKWSIEQGIQQVIDAFANGKITDYQDSRYSNVKFLTEENGANLVQPSGQWAHKLILALENEMNGVSEKANKSL